MCQRTERMPDDEGELGNLLALLAEFHKGSFASVGIEKLGHPKEDFAIVFSVYPFETTTCCVRARGIGRSLALIPGGSNSSSRVVSGHDDTIVVLLVRYGGSGGSVVGMLLSN